MTRKYLITWVEGDEVFYRIVTQEALKEIWELNKHYMVSELV